MTPTEPSEMNRRLEEVRELVRADSLREFYNHLRVVNVADFPSYPAAATYHGKPWRYPSYPYLQAILLRYPWLDARWLMLGSWPSPAETAYTKEVERVTQALREMGIHKKEK